MLRYTWRAKEILGMKTMHIIWLVPIFAAMTVVALMMATIVTPIDGICWLVVLGVTLTLANLPHMNGYYVSRIAGPVIAGMLIMTILRYTRGQHDWPLVIGYTVAIGISWLVAWVRRR